MIAEETELVVADNTGAKKVKCFRVLGQRKRYAYVGDIVRVSVKEAQPGSSGYNKYLASLAAHHRVLRAAMKTKQTVDPANADKLSEAITALGGLY